MMLIAAIQCAGQNFQDKFSVQLPDSIVSADAEWLDIDNSGLYDIVLFTTAASGERYLQFIAGDTINSPVLSSKSVTVGAYEGYVVHDYNNDNQLDFIFSVTENGSRKTILHQNNGGFNFVRVELSLPAFSLARFGDLDQNGVPEYILSGADDNGDFFTATFSRDGTGWTMVADTLNVRLSAFELVDFNGDGFEDIFMSGEMKPDSVFSAIFERDGAWYQLKARSRNLSNAHRADLDTDGTLEVIGLGNDNATRKYQIFRHNSTYTIEDRNAKNLRSLFHAEIDTDGLPDEQKLIITAADTINSIVYSNGVEEFLNHRQLRMQYFGDMEHDGDLDLLQVTGSVKISVNVLRNKLKNAPPAKPLALAVPLYDHVFVFWEKTGDDHTPSGSITYDLYLEGGTTAQDAFFDIANSKRLAVRHGNNDTNNFRLVRDVNSTTFNYAIQAVDNAYHGGVLCTGSGVNCSTVEKQELDLCSNEGIDLSAGSEASWFSLTDGYLGKFSTLEYTAERKDTVFYVAPTENGCVRVGLFEIEINNAPRTATTETRYVCSGEPVTLAADTDWTDVTWQSTKQGALGTGAAVTFETLVDDVVTATYSNGSGCIITKPYTIRISLPVISVSPENVRILRGQSVTLTALGAASYSWSPAAGLSATNTDAPVASPAADTKYTVTGSDSIGCTATASAMVYVESSGFIATLFSPNADGKNDRLKVYGVTVADPFRFEIYNREGKRVYATKNLEDATNLGWDGTTNGAEQPNGVYYWRITGTSNGRDILLNGKQEGSVVLLR